MELPKIIESILPQKKSLDDRILALVITPHYIKCALIQTSKVEILGQGEEEYQEGWENAIPAADMAIAKATNGIENANQIKKVIFSLPHDWIENDKIKQEHLQNLKKLSQDLDLSPLGFVVSPEAVIHYLQKKEGSPLTAILIFFSLNKIYVTLVHAGKKEEIQEKELSGNIIEDFKSLLAKFPSMEIYPSRILLYNHRTELEKIKEELLAYTWQKFPGFLHFPKVEILEGDIDLKSAVLAGITELGIVIEPKTPELKPEEKPEEKHEIETFVEGKDVLEKQEENNTSPIVEEKKDEIKIYEPQNQETNIEEVKIIPESEKTQTKVPKINNFLLNVKPKIKALKISLVFLPIILFVLGGVLIFAYYYLPRAKVTLVVESRALEKSLDIKIIEGLESVDEQGREIPANTVETESSGQKATTATGKKIIGDKAKGEITIYNKTNNSKSFPKGTEILYSQNLKFTLDEEVAIASASSSIEGVSFGKIKAKVTAAQIGTESNLNSGTEFTIKGFAVDSYSARNEQNFSGGTSREITTVTKEDQSRIKDALTKEIEEKAMLTLKEKLAPGEVILDKGTITTIQSAKFDKEIDQEAKDVTLELSLKIKALYYKDSDLKSIARKNLEKDIPDGYDLKLEDINVTVAKVTTVKDESTASLIIKANLLPRLDTNKIKKDIAGKYPEVLGSYFEGIKSLAGYEIKITPSLPKKLSTTPRIPENIEVNVISR